MTTIESVFLVIAAYATGWATYLLVFPLVAVALRRRTRLEQHSKPVRPLVCVIIPGRNVSRVVAKCISSVRACNYPPEKVDVLIVADHCTDNTVEHARSLGVTVLSRDDGPTGKTYTLGWTFDVLKRKGSNHDLYVVVDATAQVEPTFLDAMANCWHQGDHIVANHTFAAADNQTWYARCLALMFVHRNLQNWSREQIGISALLTGCGMAFSREYIQRFGWSLALPKTQGSHPTEDWRHAVRAVEEGYRISYADEARVDTPLRGSLTEATQQGARWERGRLINASTYALRLVWRGLCNRDHIKVFAALDAMQPPVAILAALSTTIAVLTCFIVSEDLFLKSVGYFPLMLVGLYGLIVVVRGRRDGIGLSTVIWGPLYVLWRCSAFIMAWVFLDRVSIPKQEAGAARPSPARSPSPVAQPTETDEVTEDAR